MGGNADPCCVRVMWRVVCDHTVCCSSKWVGGRCVRLGVVGVHPGWGEGDGAKPMVGVPVLSNDRRMQASSWWSFLVSRCGHTCGGAGYVVGRRARVVHAMCLVVLTEGRVLLVKVGQCAWPTLPPSPECLPLFYWLPMSVIPRPCVLA